MSLASGHTYHQVEGKDLERVTKHSPSASPGRGMIRLSPGNWFFPTDYTKFADKLYNFKVKPSDVYILTFVKVGTTWTQEIVWTMKHNPNLDNPDQDLPVLERSPFLDADMIVPSDLPPEKMDMMKPLLAGFFKHCPNADPRDGANIQLGDAIPEPRVLKTHLPLSLMPPKMLDNAKVIYVARNPSDVICSYYHHSRLFTDMKFTGTLEEFADLFLTGDLLYSPYWQHVKEAWEKRDHPNMHIILFEDMKSDIMKELKKLNQFLGTNLTEQQLENVKKHSSFSEMQKRDNLIARPADGISPMFDQEVVKKDGGFFRQGKTGDGKKKLSPEMLKRVDEYCKKYFNFGLDFN